MAQVKEDEVVQTKMKDLFTVIRQCEDKRIISEHTLSNIEKTRQQLQQVKKLSPYHKTKLKELYSSAIQDAENEAKLLREALDTVHSIQVLENSMRIEARLADPARVPMSNGALMQMIRMQGESLPVWFGKRKEPAPALCGAIPAGPNYIANVNDMVVANVKSSSEGNMWIMARIKRYIPNSHKYEVEDIDEQQPGKHILARSKIIPLPLRQPNPKTHPEALFPVNTLVLAAYPQVTCFYPAIIKECPANIRDKYVVLFKDPAYEGGVGSMPFSIYQKYVVRFKGGRRK